MNENKLELVPGMEVMQALPCARYENINSDYTKGWNDCLMAAVDCVNRLMSEEKSEHEPINSKK